MTDPDMADALFLDKHPGWTYPAMLATPAIIIETLRFIDRKRAAK